MWRGFFCGSFFLTKQKEKEKKEKKKKDEA